MTYTVTGVEYTDMDELSNTSKFWRFYVYEGVHNMWIAHWGRIGTTGNIKLHKTGLFVASNMASKKQAKGYTEGASAEFRVSESIETVTAGDLDHAFTLAAPNRAMPVASKDKVESVVEQLKKLEARLR